MEPGMIRINMNYLLVRLTHLGLAQDDSVDQNEIISYIRENSFDTKMVRGSGKILNVYAGVCRLSQRIAKKYAGKRAGKGGERDQGELL